MEQRIGIERMEEAVNLFGSFDENIRLLEAEFQVQAVNRGGEIVVSGEPENVMLAVKAVQALLTLSGKGENITDQHVRYVIGLVRSGQSERISELTQDVICITSKGRPVKPKTIGQKEYVNAILKQTVTIGADTPLTAMDPARRRRLGKAGGHRLRCRRHEDRRDLHLSVQWPGQHREGLDEMGSVRPGQDQ